MRQDAHGASMVDVFARKSQACRHFLEHETADAAHVSPASGAVADLIFAGGAERMAIGTLRRVGKKRRGKLVSDTCLRSSPSLEMEDGDIS